MQKLWSDPLNYKSIVELEQTEDDDELALNKLHRFRVFEGFAVRGFDGCADMTGARSSLKNTV